MARPVAQSLEYRNHGSGFDGHRVPAAERNFMTPGILLNFQPGGWSLQQCENCKIIFALPPGPSDVKAMEILREELERHVQQTHDAKVSE